MDKQKKVELLGEFARQMKFSMPSDQKVSLLCKYSEILEQAPLNLVSARDRDHIWCRHILDSLAASSWVTKGENMLDNGSGGGLPGIPLALMTQNRVTLLDSTSRKLNYIRNRIQDTGIENIHFICGRAETEGHGPNREKYDLVISRAMANIFVSLELSLPFVRPGGHLVLWRGCSALKEVEDAGDFITELGARLDRTWKYILPGEVVTRYLVSIVRYREIANKFPRSWKKIRSS